MHPHRYGLSQLTSAVVILVARPDTKEGDVATRTTTNSRLHHSGERTIKFGDVTVTGKAPSAELVRQNVQRSTQALERLAEALATAGVRLRPRKGIPLFSCDSDDPDVMIRTLNGKTERGRIVDGVFCPIA